MGVEPNDILEASLPGTVLCGKYRVERELARGGMGTVVVATHLKLARQVAIKLINTEGKDRAYVTARFLREARAIAGLVGENVVRILDLDEAADGTPFLVMELLDGVDLERLLLSEGKAEVARAVDWALQACAALAEAHARGIVHRDVKPANLLLLKRVDGSELIKLLDFGISKILTDELQLTRTASTLGSPLFMSPEQLLTPGSVDKRSDIWSLGVTLYRLLAGAPPFDAGDASTLAAQIAARAPTPLPQVAPELPPGLATVVMRCLEKDAGLRYPSVIAVAEALQPFRAEGRLGSAERVKFAEAEANRERPLSSLPAPLSALQAASPPPSWTLSHDVPPAPLPVPSPALAPPPAPPARSSWPGRIIFAALALSIGAAVFAATRPEPTRPPEPLIARPADPPAAVVVVPSEVAPARDAGTVARLRPVKPPPEGTRDPAELELK